MYADAVQNPAKYLRSLRSLWNLYEESYSGGENLITKIAFALHHMFCFKNV